MRTVPSEVMEREECYKDYISIRIYKTQPLDDRGCFPSREADPVDVESPGRVDVERLCHVAPHPRQSPLKPASSLNNIHQGRNLEQVSRIFDFIGPDKSVT